MEGSTWGLCHDGRRRWYFLAVCDAEMLYYDLYLITTYRRFEGELPLYSISFTSVIPANASKEL
jgi:hypothetical protein